MSSTQLACTPFEQWMLSQHSRSFPSVVLCRFHFDGKIVRPALERAVRDMVRRNPFLMARVAHVPGGARWHWDSPVYPHIEWTTHPPTDCWRTDCYMDLQEDPFLKVLVHDFRDSEGRDRCTMILQTHHACGDGLGMADATHDIFALYHSYVGELPVPLPVRDPRHLPLRNRFGLTPGKLAGLFPKLLVGLLGVRQFLMRKPAPIVPHAAPGNTAPVAQSATTIAREWTRAATDQLRACARREKVTLNELLTSGIFQGLAAFRQQRAVQQPGDWLRMMVPVNMRSSAADYAQSACNIVSTIFLDRTPGQIADRNSLLPEIHQEMELIRRNRLGLIFVLSLWVRSRFWRGTFPPVPNDCQTSIVFTNLGKLFFRSPLFDPQGTLRAGGLVLERAEFLPPLAPHVAASFTATIYEKRLQLVLRYDERVLDRRSAQSLFDHVNELVGSYRGDERSRFQQDMELVGAEVPQ